MVVYFRPDECRISIYDLRINQIELGILSSSIIYLLWQLSPAGVIYIIQSVY